MDSAQIARMVQDGGYSLRETHISWVLMGKDRVFKIKKPVRFSFLDFSTFERRRFFCEEEVRLNRRLSPDVYLGVVAITEGGGRPAIGGSGEAIDHAVEMKRLDESKKMDSLLAEGKVGEGDVEGLARIVAAFHEKAERVPGRGSPEIAAAQAEDLANFRDVIEKASGLGKWVDRLLSRSGAFVRRNAPLMRRRMSDGHVRDCHGDLHSGNVFLQDGLRIIDCIEFSPDFRCIDVASDVAFMAMDLDYSGRGDLSERFVETYLDARPDPDMELLLPFYKCYRANVRAKIAAIDYQANPTAEARERIDRYVLLAERYSKGFS